MKRAITITEPYASFIAQGIKCMETRSRYTNFRGEIYIHASKRKIPKEWRENDSLMAYLDGDPRCGMVIAKAKVVDCIRMTQEWIDDLKRNNPTEYQLGFYSVGRCAIVLDDVEAVEPFPAKGHLQIGWYLDIPD